LVIVEDASFFDDGPQHRRPKVQSAIRFVTWMVSTAVAEVSRFVLLIALFMPTRFHRPLGCIAIIVGLYGSAQSHAPVSVKLGFIALIVVGCLALTILPRFYFWLKYVQFPPFRK
jgi:hypothetical protein